MNTDYQAYKQIMSKKENFSCKEFESLLLSEGFKFRSQEGSHRIFKNEKTGIMVSFPQGKLMSVGTLRKESKKIYPNWNIKPIEPTEETSTESTFELTNDMINLCVELGLNPSELSQDEYNTLAELTSEA